MDAAPARGACVRGPETIQIKGHTTIMGSKSCKSPRQSAPFIATDKSKLCADDVPPWADLEPWGFDAERAAELTVAVASLSAENGPCRAARVVFESRRLYRVHDGRQELPAAAAGRFELGPERPSVGDWVVIDGPASSPRIVHILPRRTRLSRKVVGQKTEEQIVAANVDTVFLVMGMDGDFNLRRLERFAVMASESGAEPVVILTKKDLHADPIGACLDAKTVVPGMPVFAVCSPTTEGLEPLRAFLATGRTVALVGSSGAGKSTLLNALDGRSTMRTGAVRSSDDRGRHTTTHRQLVPLAGGGLLVDNPGVREIQLWADKGALDATFDDLAELAAGCRFRDCRHVGEPGCAVLEAMQEGRLDPERLRNHRDMERELESLERRRNVAEQRRADKKLGRLYRNVQAEKAARRR